VRVAVSLMSKKGGLEGWGSMVVAREGKVAQRGIAAAMAATGGG
jgi:hypothetical protein